MCVFDLKNAQCLQIDTGHVAPPPDPSQPPACLRGLCGLLLGESRRRHRRVDARALLQLGDAQPLGLLLLQLTRLARVSGLDATGTGRDGTERKFDGMDGTEVCQDGARPGRDGTEVRRDGWDGSAMGAEDGTGRKFVGMESMTRA